MIDAVSVDIENVSQTSTATEESTEAVYSPQTLVDGEQAIGDSLPENSKEAGLPIAMIVIVTIIGLIGLAAAGTAAINMRR